MNKTLKTQVRKILKVDGKPKLDENGNYIITNTFPVGSTVNVEFDNTKMILSQNGINVKCSAKNYVKYFGGKVPSLKALEKWSADGYCKTVTGQMTELDGFGSDGSPSWLIALSMI